MQIEKVQAVIETTRQLARIVRVDEVLPHTNADKMSLAIVGGWQCCIKLNEFKKGDLALYVEIDSLVPISHPTFAFLEERSSDLRTVNDKVYCRIKSIRLRKELSQGILLQLPAEVANTAKEGDDVTELLGVLKKADKIQRVDSNINESTLLGKIARFIAGPERTNLRPWPSFLKKSEESRIQNMTGSYERMLKDEEHTFERSIKLNGQSVTFYIRGDQVGVCSRNNEISTIDDQWDFITQVRYWLGQLLVTNRRMFRKRQWVFPQKTPEMSIRDYIKEFRDKNQANRLFTIPRWKKGIFAMDDHVVRYAITSGSLFKVIDYAKTNGGDWFVQGELIGPGIQSNFEEVPAVEFYAYKAGMIDESGNNQLGVLSPEEASKTAISMGLKYIPVLDTKAKLAPTVKEMLLNAEGPKIFSTNKKSNREGEVWKSNKSNLSFKVISNKYLIDEAATEE